MKRRARGRNAGWWRGCSCAAAMLGVQLAAAQAPPPAPPSNVTAVDHARWDNGTRIDLSWDLSPDDPQRVVEYLIFKSSSDDKQGFVPAGKVVGGIDTFTVTDLTPKPQYSFQVVAVAADGAVSAPAETAAAIRPLQQWFDVYRFWFMITMVIFCGSVVAFIYAARRGKPLKVRKIAGLEAVDEAVGRATEMGRSCLFIPGILDMNDIQTIAGLNILARVSKTAAAYDARIEVPTSRSLVMTAARETVHSSFLEAGRPDAYNDDLIYYVTDEQFGYVAYVQGLMVREKPAACFYMGAFFAESLILAETGNSIGAIQVAGTAMPSQLPFFVAACDYTLIGEEFFAASAYLTGSPEELGSLKGQDVGKVIVAVGIVAGVLAITLAVVIQLASPGSPFASLLENFVAFFREEMLT